MKAHSHCKPKHLRRLLDGSLADDAATLVADHVESCHVCRTKLETLAADETWWDNAKLFLADESDEVVFLDNSPTTGDTIQLSASADEVETTPDELVLDLLEPSERPDGVGRLGNYDLLEVIGRGGMGIVFKAYDRELNRYLAIKILAPHFASSVAARKRFAREAQAAAAVVHQHVVAIHAVEGGGKLPYLVMPFFACESLQDRIDRERESDINSVVRVGIEAARGLAAAHDQGLVHRDVKPANILLEDGTDRVLLTDFGLARAIDDAALTRSGIIVGTPQYMSPEQAKGEAIDHRTDLFSLGSVLYTMCTGHPPFRAETTMGILRRICDGSFVPLDETNPATPAWLAAIIGKLLEKEPERRYENAGEVASLLEDCLAHLQHPTSAPLPASLQPTSAGRRKNTTLAIYGVSALALAASAIIAVAHFADRPGPEHQDDAAIHAETQPGGTSAPDGRQSVLTAEDDLVDSIGSATAADAASVRWNDGIEADLSEIELRLQAVEADDF